MAIGVLLVNLGTPDSSQPKDVKRYLNQFLTDERVIDVPWLLRQFLVRGIIVPKRYKFSAKTYSEIWSQGGSPLMFYGKELEKALQKQLGSGFVVRLAMRYRKPSIKSGLLYLKKKKISNLIILPLFPHYASATTGSLYQEVFQILKSWPTIPSLQCIQEYSTHPGFIKTFVQQSQQYDLDSYDHILFSYHGLPQRQLRKSDGQGYCLKSKKCCQKITPENSSCYGAQSVATTRELALSLKLDPSRYTHCYQSRLGKETWMEPYTKDVIEKNARLGKKRLLVFCPSFVCDCLETLYEIGIEYRDLFREKGGHELDFVESLNTHPTWVETLESIIYDWIPQKNVSISKN